LWWCWARSLKIWKAKDVAEKEVGTTDGIGTMPLLSEALNGSATIALKTWSNMISGLAPLTISFTTQDLPGDQLGEASITTLGPGGNPSAGIIVLDTNAAGVGWYDDPAPSDDSEFS
jgi:hypothetical protein